MGSLPSPKMDQEELRLLFLSQQKHMNHFFDALSLPDAVSFADAVLSAPGAVFFTGVGKSGLVAQKLSQTLASLGTSRSSFLSPVDALHGDLGSLFPADLLVLLSKSGSSAELLSLVPCARAKGATLISLTSVPDNPLASLCDSNVHLPLLREACPFGLAPVTSTAVQMIFGDTVIAAIMRARGLTRDEYAANHPAGRIGKSLIFKVRDVMRRDGDVPVCREGDMIMDQLTELTSKGCGCLLVVDDGNRLVGTFTDGDLRRTLKASGEGIFKLTVGNMCNRNPRTIGPQAMAAYAMKKMEAPPSPVQFLPVVDDQNVVIGIVTLHGLVSAGL
ncbi:putative arabinose 5-phosphate isomerase [Iris pallida]|uniref:Arabinose 5-phosphate isomerase n=1 Tax=Iris pallida TaxID=29817 RepID=A0AAX6I6K7_IRIPA|nr:putative arabinose 5-phosphate isomerase [Iris pallida]KAJ6848950.1 putative arabinose 5-phosphate isomerase [Iris pallida]